jgi:hypothetical protein
VKFSWRYLLEGGSRDTLIYWNWPHRIKKMKKVNSREHIMNTTTPDSWSEKEGLASTEPRELSSEELESIRGGGIRIPNLPTSTIRVTSTSRNGGRIGWWIWGRIGWLEPWTFTTTELPESYPSLSTSTNSRERESKSLYPTTLIIFRQALYLPRQTFLLLVTLLGVPIPGTVPLESTDRVRIFAYP